MRPIIEGPPGSADPKPPLTRRLAWFFGIALAAAMLTGVVAFAMEALLPV